MKIACKPGHAPGENKSNVYSIEFACSPDEVDALSAELWEAGTAGIRELDEEGGVRLIAGFETNEHKQELLERFHAYQPSWRMEAETDWTEVTRQAWPCRTVGERWFVCPPWGTDATPKGRIRLVHNPGLACGTGEHPCTRLALTALERTIKPDHRVADIGTGSGMLGIGALLLGALQVVCADTDSASLPAVIENSALNAHFPFPMAGSAESVTGEWADVTVANISATVLFAIFDELERITKPDGKLILTGFTLDEAAPFERMFPNCEVLAEGEWRCIIGRLEAFS
jgi:ribosomal protein L11 methyltransferase